MINEMIFDWLSMNGFVLSGTPAHIINVGLGKRAFLYFSVFSLAIQ